MSKRAVGVFFVFCIFMGVISLHLFSLATGEYAAGASENNTRSIEVSDERAPIYDCNGQRITNTQPVFIAAVKPTAKGAAAIAQLIDDEEELEAVREKLSNGYPATVRVDAENTDCEDIKIIKTYGRYCENQPAAHLVGYTDAQGDGVSGLEKSFNSLFSQNRLRISAVFASDAKGRALSGAQITRRTDSDFGDAGVYLTLDIRVQKIVESCMDSSGVSIGSVVVLDPQTGAVRAMASRPVFDQLNVAASLNAENSPFINRALCSFAVGSVFKPAVACAALEQGLSPNITCECTGSIKVGEVEFGCYEHRAHGVVDMRGAIEKSCNCYFINLIQRMDKEAMISTLSALGFGGETELCSGIVSSAGSLPEASELDSPAAAANLSFGQGSLLASPLQIGAYMSAIVSGGIYRQLYIIEKTADSQHVTFEHEPKAGERVLTQETAETVAQFLKSAVENGNAKGAKPESCTAAGKTATAQTGVFEKGEELYNTWFAGWFPAENPKYIVVVMKEKGSGGASDCAPVFRSIADAIMQAGL